MSVIDYDVSGVSADPPESRPQGPPARLPTLPTLDAWEAALREAPEAWQWLRARGLSEATITYWRLGYRERVRRPASTAWAPAITIPLFKRRLVVNVKYRFLDGAKPKYWAYPGRPHVLYPGVPPRGPVILCEGEFDALIGRQHDLPTVTGTAGVRGWSKEWSAALAGRSVAVVFDSGPACFELAEARAEQLRRAGAEDAWAVDLGLEDGEDITDAFVKYGRSAAELRSQINAARRFKGGRDEY